MKHASTLRFAFLAIATLVLGLSADTAAAQSPSGAISGRVLNAENGLYLSRALVSVEGTALEVLTDDFGNYLVRDVPAGAARLRVVYTGQSPLNATVDVISGRTTQRDLVFNEAPAPGRTGTVQLDRFVVAGDRFRTAQEIAINEERFSVNIKNVVSAESFGDIPEGNVGEFVKFLPGVEIGYGGTYTSEADATGISVRGFGAEDTAIYIDGVPVANASPASLTRAVGLDMLSINNASRVELIKVPTPDMPANSIGGQINLVSKSAFEYAKPTTSIRAYLSVNSQNLDIFSRAPGPTDKEMFTAKPGFDLTYVRPVNKQLGVSVTLSSSNQFNENQRARPEWQATPVNGVDLRPVGGLAGATLTSVTGGYTSDYAHPFMSRFSLTDSPRYSNRHSGAVKVDWRPAPGLTLAANYQISVYDSADAARRLQIRIQRPQDWSDTQSVSYPYVNAPQSANNSVFNPSSTLAMNIDSRDKIGTTHTGYLKAAWVRGGWNVAAVASASTSRGSYKDIEHGHFSTVDLSVGIGRIAFENIRDGVPASTTIWDRNNAVVDFTRLAAWTPDSIQARSGKAESLDDEFTYKVDVRRELLSSASLQLAAKAGWYREQTLKKKWGVGTGYRETYTGTLPATADYLDTTYYNIEPGFGFAPQQWASTYRLYDFYLKNRSLFSAASDTDQVNNYNSYVNQNKRIKDTSDAWYLQFEGRALRNRLTFVGGVRQDQSRRTGQGPLTDSKWNFVKTATGELYRDAANPNGVRIDLATSNLFATSPAGTALRSALTAQRIAFPERVVLNTTLEGRRLQLKPLQEVRARSKGEPAPSLSTAYNLTPNLTARLAWSRSFGRIALEDSTNGLLSGNGAYVINENETAGASPAGTISVANPALKPWISDNWDYQLSYYTATGGKLAASYFTKNVKNFQENVSYAAGTEGFSDVVSAIGLNPSEYDGWIVNTSYNGIGTAKVSGYELEVQQNLGKLPAIGAWGRPFNVFANYTHKTRRQAATNRLSARPAADQTAAAGVNATFGSFTALLKGTWSDVQLDPSGSQQTITYNGTPYLLATYIPATFKLDTNFNWQFSRHYGLFFSARNALNRSNRKYRYDLQGMYPAYARWDDIRQFGVQMTFGLRGTF